MEILVLHTVVVEEVEVGKLSTGAAIDLERWVAPATAPHGDHVRRQ